MTLDGTQGAEGKVSEDKEDDPERGGELRRQRNGNSGEHQDEGPGEYRFDEYQRQAGDVLGQDDIAQPDGCEQIELHARGIRAEDVVERAEQPQQRIADRSREQVGWMARKGPRAKIKTKTSGAIIWISWLLLPRR